MTYKCKLAVRQKKVLKNIAWKLKRCLRLCEAEKERMNRKLSESLRRSLAAKRKAIEGIPHSSSYRGVCWESRNKKWKASIKHKGVKIHIGLYANELEAARAYDDKARELHGVKAKLNFC